MIRLPKMNKNIYVGLVIVIYLIAVWEAFYIHSKPIVQYEIDLYSNVKNIIYINIALYSIISYIFIMKCKQFSCFLRNSMILSIATLSSITILFPYIRGVTVANSGDTLTHIGYTRDILLTGNINFGINIYPLLHILTSAIVLILDTHVSLVSSLLNPLLSLSIYPLAVYILSKKRIPNTTQIVPIISLFIAFTFPLNYFASLYNSFTAPNALAYMLLPIYVYILIYFLIRKDVIILIILQLLLLSSIITHPLLNFMIIFSIFAMILIMNLTEIRKKNLSLVTLLAFYTITSIAYLVYLTQIWKVPIMNLVKYLSGNIIIEQTVGIFDKTSKLGLDFWQLIYLSVKTIIHQALLIFLTFLYFIKNIRKHSKTEKHLIFLSVYSVLFVLFTIQVLTPSFLNIAYYRFLLGILAISPPLISELFGKRFNTRIKIVTIVLIVISVIIGYQIVYPSPYSLQINPQATSQDITTSGFILTNSLKNFKMYGYLTTSVVGRSFALHTSSIEEYEELRGYWAGLAYTLPNHLGYPRRTLEVTPLMDSYIVLSTRDILAYTTVWKSVGRINWRDFRHFNSDYNTNLIYTSGQNWVYRV